MSNVPIEKAQAPKVLCIGFTLLLIRFIPAKTYNKILLRLIRKIDKRALPYYALDFISIIKYSKNISVLYRNSKEEANAIIKQFDCFSNYQNVILNDVKKYRMNYDLPI